MNDRRWIYTAALVRSTATGLIGVILGIHLGSLDLDAAQIGRIIASGLAGAAVGAAWVTFWGDRVGRRASLLLLTAASTLGAGALLLGSGALFLGIAAFGGMVNGMGRDRGAAPVVEQAILPTTAPDGERTYVFARYNVVQDVGHALGGLLAGIAGMVQGGGSPEATRTVGSLALYTVLCGLPALAYLRLTPAIEMGARRSPVTLSPQTRPVLLKIVSLFALDGVGGGFLTTALVSYFFHQRFGLGAETLGPFFFAARVANAASHFGAAWLARRIGLVPTMVFTHLPSSLLLVAVAFAPSFPLAAALFLVRESLVEMDVPTRQSYVMAMVRPEERTFASGVTHVVRLAAWAVAPVFAGLVMKDVALYMPLLVGAGVKIAYDLLLWRAFRRLRPPEEIRP